MRWWAPLPRAKPSGMKADWLGQVPATQQEKSDMQENPAVRAEATDGTQAASSSRGLGFAVLAYLLWGMLPLYMKAVDFIPAVEVVAHRVLWSLPVAGVILLAIGRTSDIKAALRQPRTMLMAALTAAIISANWGIYVWAIAVDRTVETALG